VGDDISTGGPDRLDARWIRSPAVHAVELDGEAVLYDSPGGRLHVLNPSATLVWSCLDGSVSGGDLAAELAEAFGVDPATMASQVAEVLATLTAEGLICPA
jgi:PqqD family protein of HPr-rel-A system